MAKTANDIAPDAPATSLRPDALLAIARAASQGEPDAVTTLVLEVGGSMLRIVRKVLGHGHPDIEDVTQDATLAMLAGLRDFRADCTVQHFANRVALLTALSARRRMMSRGRFAAPDASIEHAIDEHGVSPLSAAISGRRRELLLELLAKLPEPTAEAIAMHFVLGYTVDEIASTSGVSENTVWSRLRLGKQALRRGLANDARLTDLLREQGS